MTKTFKIIDKDLHVSIDLENDVFIPVDKEKVKIGKYKQTTVQMIQEDGIEKLKTFISDEKDKVEKQLNQFKKQYEQIKDLQDIDEDIMKACKKAIDKGSKAFKIKMEVLNKRINDLDRKNGLKAQIEYLETQFNEISDDLTKLNKAIK
jgi:chromosome segregation ATPase